MPAHESRSDLEILLVGLLARSKHSMEPARIGSERLFHEDMHAALHGVVEMRRTDVGIGREHRHVARSRTQGVDGVTERVEADELAVGRDVDAVAEPLAQRIVRSFHSVFEEVGHRVESYRRSSGSERVGHRAAPSPSRTDQRQPDRVVLAGVDGRQRRTGQGRSSRHHRTSLDEIAARRTARFESITSGRMILGALHGELSCSRWE